MEEDRGQVSRSEVIRLGGEHFHLLRHLTSPLHFIFDSLNLEFTVSWIGWPASFQEPLPSTGVRAVDPNAWLLHGAGDLKPGPHV